MERLHVLVTRTGVEGQSLADKVAALGPVALHLPLVRLRGPADPAQVRRNFSSLPAMDGLILTSKEGVRQAAALGFLASLQTTLTIVPGPGTRSLAIEMGQRQVRCPGTDGGNSEAMLAMAELQDVAGKQWLILAASDGRRLLDRSLQARGARVHRLTVYRRSPEPPDEASIQALRAAPNWISLIASGSALDRLATSLPGDLWDKLRAGSMIVPSERLHQLAGACGASKVIVSAGAGDQDMLDALKASTSGR